VRSTHSPAIISATVVCSARLQLACGMAAGFDISIWLDLAQSSTCLRHTAGSREQLGSLSLNYDGVVGRTTVCSTETPADSLRESRFSAAGPLRERERQTTH